jgi:hypothetical protein
MGGVKKAHVSNLGDPPVKVRKYSISNGCYGNIRSRPAFYILTNIIIPDKIFTKLILLCDNVPVADQ